MKKLFENKKFIGITSLVLATSMVLGTIAIRRSKNSNGLVVGVPQVNAASNLLDYDSSSQVNYSTVLGRAVDYGILSREIHQGNHMQTTFATSYYEGGTVACDADIAGRAPAQFIIAEMSDGSRFMFEKTYNQQPMNYVVDTTPELANDPTRFNNSSGGLITFLPRTYDKDVLNSNIESMIGHIKDESQELAQKPAMNVDDYLQNTEGQKYVLDLDNDAYEGATLYFNVEAGSRLLTAMGDNLTIKKRDSTVVVFNVLQSDPVTLNKFFVEIDNQTYNPTTIYDQADSQQNIDVDSKIARKFIWNVVNSTDVTLKTCAGVFLVPTDGAQVQTDGAPSAGWIAVAGKMILNKGIEFHFIYRDRAMEGNDVFTSYMHFATKKAFTKDLDDPRNDANVLTNVRIKEGDFEFTFVEMKDGTFTEELVERAEGEDLPTYGNDEYGKVVFPTLSVDVTRIDPKTPTHRYFVIKEVKDNSGDNNITMSDGEIDIDLEIRNIEGIIHYYIKSWHYATADAKAQGRPFKVNMTNTGEGIEMSGTEFSLGGFYNEYKVETGSLNVTKTVEFTNGDDGFPTNKTYKVAVKKGNQYVQDRNGKLGIDERIFELSSGDTLTIDGLSLGEYTIVEKETDLPGFVLTTTYTDSDTVTLASDGDEQNVTVKNSYRKVDLTGKASIKVTKTVEVDGQTTSLPSAFADKEYKFVIKAGDQFVQDINGTLGYTEKTFTIKNGEELLIVGLDPDRRYTVEEKVGRDRDVTGYKFSDGPNGGSVTADRDITFDATTLDHETDLVNKYTTEKGYLKITKIFLQEDVNYPAGSSTQISAEDLAELDLTNLVFHVTGPNFDEKVYWRQFTNGSYTFPDAVPEGRYTVEEYVLVGNDKEGLSATNSSKYRYSQTFMTDNIQVRPAPNANNPTNAEIKNLYRNVDCPFSSVTISKSVGPSTLAKSSYNVYVTTMNEGVVEYCRFDSNGVFIGSEPVTANTDMSVYKVSIPTANGGSGSVQLTKLPLGSYTVTEVEEDALIPEKNLMVSYSNNNFNITQYDFTKNVSIGNTYSDYSITVKKNVVGTAPYATTTYQFAVMRGTRYVQANGSIGDTPYYFTAKAGEEQKIAVPADGEYTIVERYASWAPEGNVYADDYNVYYDMETTYVVNGVSGTDGTVALNSGDPTGEVEITNTYTYKNVSDLSITKVVSGDTDKAGYSQVADTSFPISVKLDQAGTYHVELSEGNNEVVNNEYPADITFAANTAVLFELKAGQTITIRDIVKGTKYVVNEVTNSLPEGFSHDPSQNAVFSDTQKTIDGGVIDGSGNVVKGATDTVEITNVYTEVEKLATLNIVKNDDKGTALSGVAFTLTPVAPAEFTAETTISGAADGSSVGSFTTNGSTIIISGLKSGTYTLVETSAPSDYVKYDGAITIVVENGEVVSVTPDPTSAAVTFNSQTGTITITNNEIEKTTATIKKVWDDAGNQDGKRPTSLKVTLSNGTEVTLNEGNNWTAKVENLPKYANGVEIVYTWTEDEDSLPAGYSLTATEVSGTITTLTNSYTPETVQLNVKKVWNDSDNQDGKRPASLTVNLKVGENTVDTVVLNATNNWQASSQILPKYANGVEIAYEWVEVETELPDGYALTSKAYDSDNDVTVLTNSYSTEETSATVKKVWDDGNNQDGIRPASVYVALKADGAVVSGYEAVELNTTNNWEATVEHLPAYANGQKINYTWTEDESRLPQGYTLTNTSTEGTITTLTNSHTPEETTATVKKVWNDAENQDGKRPTELKVTLSNGAEVTLSDENNWEATVENLPKYANGVEIDYTWTEDENSLPDGYTLVGSSKSGNITTITNKHVPEEISMSVKKEWNDKNNQDGIRPSSIYVKLMQGQTQIDGVTLDADNNWTVTVDNLPKYANGVPISYSWAEDENSLPDGYELESAVVEGTLTILTNKHETEVTTATVVKSWNDSNNQDGKRPVSIKVSLLADGIVVEDYKDVILDAAGGWTATIENLPKKANGQVITYTWTEDQDGLPEGYALTGTDLDGNVTTFTNSYNAEEMELTVKKVWDDADNQDGKRPASIKVKLSNGTEVTLNATNNWEYTVKNLPVYENGGQKITYTWTEDETGLPDGYTLSDTDVNGTITTFTNSYIPETIQLQVEKNWDDANNQDGKRPASLTVNLKAGGTTVDTVVLNETNNWQATSRVLPKYADGVKIAYEWFEDANELPDGYTLTSKDSDDQTNVTVLTNSYSTEETSATVKKAWDDKDNQDGIRPDSVSVTLKADGAVVSGYENVALNATNNWEFTVSGLPKYANGQKINYTWTEDESLLPAGYTLTNTSTEGTITTLTNSHTPEETTATVKKVWNDANDQDGKRPTELKVTLSNGTEVTLNDANGWEETVENLPKYANGVEIDYTWTEDENSLPDGYTLIGSSKNGTITTLTNSYTPEETEATIKKVWSDSDNQDGKRPTELKVTLSNGTEVTLNEQNSWTQTVDHLPKYANGQEVTYTWAEDESALPTGYSLTDTSVNGTITTLTNSYTPEVTSATVKKVWSDSDNQDGKRPAELKVTLSNGTEVTLNDGNSWEDTVYNLPKYANGVEIVYTWTEDPDGLPEGYTLTKTEEVKNATGTITTLTNSYKAEETEATIKKVWNDADNQDGKRPSSINVTLSDGTEVTLNEQNNWTYTAEHLPVYENGQKITYTWTEDQTGLPQGYSLTDTSVNGTITTLTNSYKPEVTTATVKKVWSDSDNRDGKRPAELNVTLSNGTTVKLNQDNNWEATVENLPKYANGQLINYTWTEDANGLPDGYTLTNTDVAGTVTTFTNSYNAEETEATIVKVWDDANNQDGIRPDSITVTLSNGTEVTLNAANNWKYTAEHLPAYENGRKITYTWTEDETGLPTGYSLTNTAVNGTITTLTNTHAPATTDVTVQKTWVDANDLEGFRPSTLTVTLLADGTVVDAYKDVVLSAADGWTKTITDLPMYKDGNLIDYTWSETGLPTSYSLTAQSKNGSVTTLTNTHNVEYTEATIVKVWDDANNQDGKRPSSIKVTLSNGMEVTLNEQNGWTATVKDLPKFANGQEITYTWTEDTSALSAGYALTDTTVNGTVTTLTNSYTTEKTSVAVQKVWNDSNNQDGKRPAELKVTLSNGTVVTLNEANGWFAKVENLPKYANGQEITYTWTEGTMPADYALTGTETSTDNSGMVTTTLTNSYKTAETSATIKKVWDDANNQDAKRPASVTVSLLADGTVVEKYKAVVLTAANEWTTTITGLPMNNNGKQIVYTWAEDETGMPQGYSLTDTSVNGTITTLTNSYTTEETSATVKKIWNDADNQDGKRPADLKVTLSNGTEVTLSAANNWSATVEHLPKYANGVEIVYTWAEDQMPQGYALTDTSVNGTVTTLTNSYTTAVTSATVKKVWSDSDNQDGKRPASVTVSLLADGNLVENYKAVVLTAADGWTKTIENLPMNKNGKAIVYTWAEDETGLPQGYSLTDTSVSGTITTLTNSYTTEETTATVKKVWNDADNQDGKRPAELKVTLSNGTEVTLNAANSWSATVEHLPKYANGVEIVYTWTEDQMPQGYSLTDTSVNGTVTTLTNSYTTAVTSATVKKVWDDADNQDGIRPSSLTVTLSNGKEVTLNEANGWTATVDNLPAKANGVDITYTWTESNLPTGYTLTDTSVNGTVTTLTNSHTPETISVSVKKVWNDSDNQDRVRPDSLTVSLMNGQNKAGEVTLTEANNWEGTITGLPKCANGQEIVYTWSEGTMPAGYTLTNTQKSGNLTTLTNSYTTAVTSATVKKVWDDANDQDGIRPTELKVKLSNGAEVTLNESNNWSATVDNLPKYNNGVEIDYTWTEDALPNGYTLTSTQKEGSVTTLTNSHTPEQTEATVKKVWDDNDNYDGMRPADLVVTLSNGDTVTLNEGNNWEATITGLPKFSNGQEIPYTWTEGSMPDGYTLASASTTGTVTTLTNSFNKDAAKTEATVKKVWQDDGHESERPASIKITLSNGAEVTLDENNGWTATVSDLQKYDADGKEIVYTWTENNVPDGYELTDTSVNGTVTTLTNTYTKVQQQKFGKLVITKALGADAPDSAKSKTYTFTVTGPDGYSETVTIVGAGSAELDNLKPGKYTITEDKDAAEITDYILSVANSGVTVEIQGDDEKTATITNTYTKETKPTEDTTPTGGDTQPTEDTTPTDDTAPTGNTAPSEDTQATEDTAPTDTQPTNANPTGRKPTSTEATETEAPSEGPTAPADSSETEGPATPVPTPVSPKEIDSVTIDGNPISSDDYAKKDDGTVELTDACIEKLTLGKHRVVVTYTDGSTITVEFEVVTSTSRTGKKIVKTGDTNDYTPVITALFLIMVASAAAAVVLVRRRREETDS